MGVKHLWTLLQAAGMSFDYEALQGQVISVDINIWLHQIQSHRSAGQNPHTYLIDLLKRICKLLNYGIKPIFVFDGAHPLLKRDTIISRDLRRKNAQKQHDEAKYKHILKTIHYQLLQGQIPCISSTSSGLSDMFELPTTSTVLETDHSDEEFDELTSIDQIIHLDPKSEIFSHLPPDIQLDILSLKQKIGIVSIPNDPSSNQADNQNPEDVSMQQISKLLNRESIRKKIETINREQKELTNSSVIGPGIVGYRVHADRVSSHEGKHVILVKNSKSNDTKFSIQDCDSQTMEFNDEPYTPVTHVGGYYEGTDVPQGNNGGIISETQYETGTDTKNGPVHIVKVSFTDGTQILAEQAPNGKLTSITSCHSQSGIPDINPECVTSSIKGLDDLTPPLDGIHLSAKHQGFKRSKSPKHITTNLELTLPPVSAVKTVECLSHVSDDVFQITPSLTPQPKRMCVQNTPAFEVEPNLGLYTETVPNSASEDSIAPTPISDYPPNSADQSNACLIPLPPSSDESDQSAATLHSSDPSLSLGTDLATDSIPAVSSSLEDIRKEMSALTQEVAHRERHIHGVTREIQDAVMELLAVFGIPYIVAPFEAEAQCAYLELNRVTTGTITDDSDIFLFGGHTVYRHFFNIKSRNGPQLYCMDRIKQELELTREDLIRLAFLLGCDYTEGVKGVGIKNAPLLLKSFRSEGMNPLTDILAASETAKLGVLSKCGGEDGLLGRAEFPKGFPDNRVWNAFLTPQVDAVPPEFQWGSIDVSKFVDFSKRYFNWRESQAREQITPVLRRQNTPKQTKITIPRPSRHIPVPRWTKANYSGPKLSSGSESD